MWIYIVGAIAIYMILRELIRLPRVGKYGDRYVFITGCDYGFGNMLAKRLDFLGFNVFAGCFTEKGGEELVKVSSKRLKTVPLDVTKQESIEKAHEFVLKQLPADKGLWAIVNNAGITGAIGVTEWLTRADYEACLEVNLYGVIEVTRVFLPLVRKGKGRIVNIASMMGRIAAASAPYCISKYGVEAFSDCLRREVLKQGLSVHILEPGYFRTNIINFASLKNSMTKAFNQASPEVQQYYGYSFVDKTLTMVEGMLEKFSSPKIHLVVDAYTHAITAMFPRPRYLVGNDCKYFYRVLWNLPEFITDKILTMKAVVPEGAK